MKSDDLSPDQLFPHSAGSQNSFIFSPDPNSPRTAGPPSDPLTAAAAAAAAATPLLPGRGPIPKFRPVPAVPDLRPRVQSQPLYRRANPEGGFISVHILLLLSLPLSLPPHFLLFF
jgi:dual specificity protein kinase YAK1